MLINDGCYWHVFSPDVLRRRLFLRRPHRHGGRDLGGGEFLQRRPGGLRGVLDGLLVRPLQLLVVVPVHFLGQQVGELAVDHFVLRVTLRKYC